MGDTTREEKVIQGIETLVKVLGTMVVFPDYKSDPANIGVKIYAGNVQQPILLGSERDKAINKLVELINKL